MSSSIMPTLERLQQGPLSLQTRALGAYLGLAVGDALGATVEFLTRSEIRATYGVHREIRGGGWLALPAGAVTDDTEMSLALGAAIIREGRFELSTIAEAFVAWLRTNPPDCGNTCRRGIQRYLQDGSFAGPMREDDGGNGAVMRNLPVVLCSLGDDTLFTERTLAQCHFTHHHPLSDAAALCLGRMTSALIQGESFETAMEFAAQLVAAQPLFGFHGYHGPATAYVVDTVCTVLRHVSEAESFEDAVVNTVNCGDDADTTGALTGMLAGARYGVQGIPRRWLAALMPDVRGQVALQARKLVALSPAGCSE